jgi:hypothetical protein
LAAPDQAAKRVAVIAAIYPLWGALTAVGISQYLIPADAVLTSAVILRILILWLVLSAIEERVFRIAPGRHILGAAILGLCWVPFLWKGDPSRFMPLAFITQTVSRSSAMALAWVSRPDRNGMALTRKMTGFSGLVAAACGAAAAFTLSFRIAVLTVLASFVILRAIREWFYRRTGGISPVAVSIAQRATELSTLLIVSLAR